MTDSRRCTVVIVNCNGADWVVRCVESVVRKGPRDGIDIVVVDNASTDGSREALAERFTGAPVRIVANPTNRGFGAACNQGAAIAQSDCLLFLNSDCEFIEDALSLPLSILSRRPELGILFCRLLNGDRTLQPSINTGYPGVMGAILESMGWTHVKHAVFRTSRLKKVLLAPVIRRHGEAHPVAWGGGNYMLVRKSAFEAVGGFDETFFMYYEDADLCRRVNEKGWMCFYDPGVSVIHHWARSVPTEGIIPLLENYRSRLHYFHKHHRGFRWIIGAACGFEILTRLGALELLCRVIRKPGWERARQDYARAWAWFRASA